LNAGEGVERVGRAAAKAVAALTAASLETYPSTRSLLQKSDHPIGGLDDAVNASSYRSAHFAIGNLYLLISGSSQHVRSLDTLAGQRGLEKAVPDDSA
jgi:hypothetical protein